MESAGVKTVLAIGGFDPSGGAGLIADIRALLDINIHSAGIVTVVTAQNTRSVSGLYSVSPEVVRAQLRSILEDMDISAVKVGLLHSPGVVEVVAGSLKGMECPVIVDPVLVSTSGQSLCVAGTADAIKEHLVPLSTLFTPNRKEAEVLSGIPINSNEDARSASKIIKNAGAENILLKGGHIYEDGNATDLLYDGEKFIELSMPRLSFDVRGTGCTMSSLIAGYMSEGRTIEDAVRSAKRDIHGLIASSKQAGAGARVVVGNDEDAAIVSSLKQVTGPLLDMIAPDHVAEVGLNIAYARKEAKAPEDVCALDSRIVLKNGVPATMGVPRFGASHHIASIVLAGHSIDPGTRSAMNLRFSEKNLEGCRFASMVMAEFRRTEEPESSNSTMSWGTRKAIEDSPKFPDVVWDRGDLRKEPMLRVLGKDPNDVIRKVKQIVEASHERKE